MTVILCLLPLPSDTQRWSIANLHDPRVMRTSRSSPLDSVGLVSGLDSNNLLQDLMHWSGGVQAGHVSEQHVTSFNTVIVSVMFGRPVWTASSEFLTWSFHLIPRIWRWQLIWKDWSLWLSSASSVWKHCLNAWLKCRLRSTIASVFKACHQNTPVTVYGASDVNLKTQLDDSKSGVGRRVAVLLYFTNLVTPTVSDEWKVGGRRGGANMILDPGRHKRSRRRCIISAKTTGNHENMWVLCSCNNNNDLIALNIASIKFVVSFGTVAFSHAYAGFLPFSTLRHCCAINLFAFSKVWKTRN